MTVFTPFYDNVRYIDETIRSVLSQSFTDFEYLMINDGPEALAEEILAKHPDPRIRIVTSKTRLGLSGSRNAGLHEARGELIAFIDSDDYCEPGRFERQVRFLDEHPDHVLVGGAIRFIDESSRTIGHRRYAQNDAAIRRTIAVANCIAQPAVMARRAALINAGGYRSEFPAAEDYDLWLRVAALGRFHNLPDVLVAYRIHAEAGKRTLLRPALRDTLRLKIKAIRKYGFALTLPLAVSIAANAFLLLLPESMVFWLFRRLVASR